MHIRLDIGVLQVKTQSSIYRRTCDYLFPETRIHILAFFDNVALILR